MWMELIVLVVWAAGEPPGQPPVQLAERDNSRAWQTPTGVDVPAQKSLLAQWAGRRPAWQGAGFGMRPFGAAAGMPGWGAAAGPALWGAQVDDAGPALVDLIQKTIAPGHWASQGGPGAIYYWRPGRALVIQASQEAHEEVGQLLRQLERSGR